jgi:hypothetical protein
MEKLMDSRRAHPESPSSIPSTQPRKRSSIDPSTTFVNSDTAPPGEEKRMNETEKRIRFDARNEEIWNQMNSQAGDWTVIKTDENRDGETIDHAIMNIHLEDPDEYFQIYIQYWREESQIDFMDLFTNYYQEDLREHGISFPEPAYRLMKIHVGVPSRHDFTKTVNLMTIEIHELIDRTIEVQYDGQTTLDYHARHVNFRYRVDDWNVAVQKAETYIKSKDLVIQERIFETIPA